MRYTLWLDGHLLGETRLEHRNPMGRQRMGALRPTPFGLELLPGLCGFLSAAAAVKRCMTRRGIEDPDAESDRAMHILETTPEGEHFTRVVSALARLELRQASGERAAFHTVIVTSIGEIEQLSAKLRDPSTEAAFGAADQEFDGGAPEGGAPEGEAPDDDPGEGSGGPRFIISATPVDMETITSALRRRPGIRVRAEPN